VNPFLSNLRPSRCDRGFRATCKANSFTAKDAKDAKENQVLLVYGKRVSYLLADAGSSWSSFASFASLAVNLFLLNLRPSRGDRRFRAT
jgi:hypothetical protein